ncbi:uncharacterized protein P174DRAFT_367100 [Aspergillus novofumigatus IBT 16806]|uniref:Rhamnogalacturonase A/B/Epimerase-like pectate lyase domain-containing protein n=1 Tax=Aspergillus novofumigatus (strain IBT 16806) TaxID=1392255 RepID=A0A2I1CED5_ASPN1|nr:uncharacterized protein P174DRAFT_367100 [Aspergillus novofumigatus IBT 16806]PKX95973.1 hypothetical protein P174DRAFT_367100 [Aspergillus novofumigatus IBT 16806]
MSSSIVAMYNTQLVGDSTDPPTIRAARSFVSLGVISSDVIPTRINFFRQVHNFIFDIRQVKVEHPAGLHGQVAQVSRISSTRSRWARIKWLQRGCGNLLLES